MKKRLFAALLVTCAFTASSQATVIDFNADKTYHASGLYQEDGFRIAANEDGANKNQTLVFWGDNSAHYNADSKGNTLTNNYAGATLTLTKSGGGTFSFDSIDMGDGANSTSSGNVIFNFFFANGLTSQKTVTLDNIVGLQTFVFNLTNLSAVSWTPLTTTAKRSQVDNIVLDTTVPANPVPEPASLTLAGIGLMVLAASRFLKARADS
ncbi:PEP-CTERM sorting domain-containing protein [Undibacterium terreum]|uniref:PEP-CTERM sorting domain-containing protein n=1 Tax=Undibacterium terreum TaxID=1224302 RepID=UPI001665E252|nr:PEP-CTERM sorting domain-containing protein [Undibacterium terreum]